MTRPGVTVGVPVRNGAAYLSASLDSLVAQDYDDIEIVISDNASTDETPEICGHYAARDDRIRYVRQPTDIGAAGNFNFLVGEARCPLYKSLSHDDLIAPSLVRRCVDRLEERPEAVLAFAGTRVLDADGVEVDDEDPPARWTSAAAPSGRLRDLFADHARSHLHHCFPVMGVLRTEPLRQTRLIQPFQSSDTVLLVELALRGGFAEVPERLSFKRRHPGTSVNAHRDPAAAAAWFDPANRGRFPMPRTRLLLGYTEAVLRAPLATAERARCLAEVGRWLARERRWRVIGGELRRRARQGVSDARSVRATTIG
jgi:hypothetical protein